jgi:hypothetical protein
MPCWGPEYSRDVLRSRSLATRTTGPDARSLPRPPSRGCRLLDRVGLALPSVGSAHGASFEIVSGGWSSSSTAILAATKSTSTTATKIANRAAIRARVGA